MRTFAPFNFRRRLLATVIAAMFGLVGLLWFVVAYDRAPFTRPSAGIVDAGPSSAYVANQPKYFDQARFFLLKLDDGDFVAFYAYPPDYYGHQQGCKLDWNPSPALDRAYGQQNLWVEYCGPGRWDAMGHRLAGATSRDLDRFPVSLRRGHVLVDSSSLECNAEPCEKVGISRVSEALTSRADFGVAKVVGFVADVATQTRPVVTALPNR